MKIKTKFIKIASTMLLAFAILSSFFIPSQTVNAANVTVKLYMYVCDSTTSGRPALSGVLVTGKDGNGAYFSQTTDANGNVSIPGATGAWTFTASMYGYQTSTWMTYVSSSTTIQGPMIPSAQSPIGLY